MFYLTVAVGQHHCHNPALCNKYIKLSSSDNHSKILVKGQSELPSSLRVRVKTTIDRKNTTLKQRKKLNCFENKWISARQLHCNDQDTKTKSADWALKCRSALRNASFHSFFMLHQSTTLPKHFTHNTCLFYRIILNELIHNQFTHKRSLLAFLYNSNLNKNINFRSEFKGNTTFTANHWLLRYKISSLSNFSFHHLSQRKK